MLEGLDAIDWASMHHAYGTAEEVPRLLRALRSPDADERKKALDRFYGAVHHQGDVYACTAASVPFLVEMARDATTPDRASLVSLVVSIGSSTLEYLDYWNVNHPGEPIFVCAPSGEDCGDALWAAIAALRAQGAAFVAWAADADARLRREAIPGLGLFLDDENRAVSVLLGRLAAEPGIAERLEVVETLATLTRRTPDLLDDMLAWFDAVAADPSRDPATRLAALVQRARCAPDQIGDSVVPTALDLLDSLARLSVPAEEWADPPQREVPPADPAPASEAPPQVVAAFEAMERQGRSHAPTTGLLRTFHETLGSRVPQRTALLVGQLGFPDPGTRLDAIRMSGQLMESWRGDHTFLVLCLADQLADAQLDVATEAAEVLDACHPIAGPARETLAAHVAAQRAAHGPDVWAAPSPRLRRAHQEAVRALARLGDERAVPSLLVALESGVDDWRAAPVARALPGAADQLVPPLCALLRRLDPTQHRSEMSASALLSTLGALGDPAALPVIVDVLATAPHHGRTACAALESLAAFGPAAAPALAAIRPLTASANPHVNSAALCALWAVGRDHDEVLPLLRDRLDETIPFQISGAAETLGQIGPRAAAALPRLRELLAHNYEWVRVPCAAAIWEIGGEPEAPVVLDTLLQAWNQNPATANDVVACLDRMGPAAAPALPTLRGELALPNRRGRFDSIDTDEELQRVSRAILARFA
ncbi:HEAT repeat domain-containing protein [Frankia sp. CNm7]|uniref:PBS lyase n=2 Tax=Frankia nepalensis TaxID=1836974 RepID=A0A937UM69_9ACTN|nr:hypothetical protein [Frankia nepalensis]MBL7497077.1 HEAT repeat domain-containing protein [Frankia nepalensis]MBL7510748.1 HEAT repeat domain-containing protein [Frankia nepalensis]MBL7522466.1 HEAT repeat domain-containing protein [Frankia nepalensis]MBL7626758.1 hypothetical protein [Frankia nepalensis]